MVDFKVSLEWQNRYPGASVGVLAMNDVENPRDCKALDQQKEELQSDLRQQYSGYDRQALNSIPIFEAYKAYYKRFKKSYHVQLQLESVALKGKQIPNVAALVEAMFMAELKNLLLTAGHDRSTLEMPLGIHVSDGTERYLRFSGQEQRLKEGDMYIADAMGVMSSIIYGPDQRTSINHDTHDVLFTNYAPTGINPLVVDEHLHGIQAYLKLISPDAKTDVLEVIGTV